MHKLSAGPVSFTLALVAWSAALVTGCSGRAGTFAQPVAASDFASQQSAAEFSARPIWMPKPGMTWQWQLTGTVDPIAAAQAYDVDLFDNTSAKVAQLHALHSKVICYLDAGSWEKWRPDADQFPPIVLGKVYNGFPDERWLDIRRIDILGPIMNRRLDMCKSKGFDGVEFDNVEGYNNNTGFPLTAIDQLRFNRYLANQAHLRGISAALKNDGGQVPQLLPDFDFAIVEQCFEFQFCNEFQPFINAGKAVLETEYNLPTTAFCPQARALRFSSMRKNVALDRFRQSCWKQ